MIDVLPDTVNQVPSESRQRMRRGTGILEKQHPLGEVRGRATDTLLRYVIYPDRR